MARRQVDVAATAVLAILACDAAVSGAPVAVTAVLGLALLVMPGYLLSQLLLSSRIVGLERAVVATSLGLAVPVLGGLLLNEARVPLHRSSWLGLLAGVTLAADAVLFLRRHAGRVAPFTLRPHWWRIPPWHAAAFAAAVLVASGGLVLARIGAAIQPQPGFTQLWLSARNPNARTASLGVSNDEGSTTRYRLVLLRNDRLSTTWNLTLPDGTTWQQAVPFVGNVLAANLYRLPDLTHPYRYVTTDVNSGQPRRPARASGPHHGSSRRSKKR
jgi:hypothetical protein